MPYIKQDRRKLFDPTLNVLDETIERSNPTAGDLNYIITTVLHGRQPNPNQLKMLGGKLGIKFYHDKNLNKWVIEKQ